MHGVGRGLKGAPVPDDWRVHRARLAALRRHHPDQPELVATEQRLLKVKHAESYITRLLTDPPELNVEERGRLAAMLLAPPAQGGGEHVAAQ